MSISIQNTGSLAPAMNRPGVENEQERKKSAESAAPAQRDTVSFPKQLDGKGAEQALSFIQNTVSEQDAEGGFGHSFDMDRIAQLLGD